MILDDPIAMYLNEGGMINPGFRLRNPEMVQEEVPQEATGIPDIPLEAQAEDLPNYRTSRYVPNPYVDGGVRGAEVGSVGGRQQLYANNRGMSLDYRLTDIPDLDVGVPSFGNTSYIGR